MTRGEGAATRYGMHKGWAVRDERQGYLSRAVSPAHPQRGRQQRDGEVRHSVLMSLQILRREQILGGVPHAEDTEAHAFLAFFFFPRDWRCSLASTVRPASASALAS
jgi:hypothetical protein